LVEKKVANIALEARDKKLRDQLRATEEELRMKSSVLLEADRHLADNQVELARMWGKLGERSLVAFDACDAEHRPHSTVLVSC
jgi:hypothetical protein